MTPQGKVLKQQDLLRWSSLDQLIIICGQYEGFDERVRCLADEEISPLAQVIDPEVAIRQVTRLSEMRETRDSASAESALEAIGKAAGEEENLFPYVLHAVKCECSLGEIIIAMKKIFGSYRAPSGF